MTMRPLKPLLYALLALGLVVLSFVFFKAYTLLIRPMSSSLVIPIIIEVKPNSNANDLVDDLFLKKLIPSKKLLLELIRFEGLAPKLKAGIYHVIPGESAHHFVLRVVKGDVLQLYFPIIEGTTAKQIEKNMKEAVLLQYQDADWDFIKKNHASAEGLLLADTYQYPAGSKAELVLKAAHKKLEEQLEAAWKDRDKDLPYTNSYELLTAASILEKETAIASERKLISGIIINRMKKHMPLQMDPSVVYAMGEHYNGKLSHSDLLIDSPYNTYRYRGLPPTPIAMVGRLAIEAAAHPEHSNYLYFVAKGDGSHIFSKTYEEQRQAISRYLFKRNP